MKTRNKILIIVGIVVVIGGSIALYMWNKKKSLAETPPKPEVPKTPEQIQAETLEQIATA